MLSAETHLASVITYGAGMRRGTRCAIMQQEAMALEQLLMLGLNFLMCHSLPQVFVMFAILCGHA